MEESKKEKEELLAEKEKMVSTFKEAEKKAIVAQKDYKKTQEALQCLSFL